MSKAFAHLCGVVAFVLFAFIFSAPATAQQQDEFEFGEIKTSSKSDFPERAVTYMINCYFDTSTATMRVVESSARSQETLELRRAIHDGIREWRILAWIFYDPNFALPSRKETDFYIGARTYTDGSVEFFKCVHGELMTEEIYNPDLQDVVDFFGTARRQ